MSDELQENAETGVEKVDMSEYSPAAQVLVDGDQLRELVKRLTMLTEENITLKRDAFAMANVFKVFSGLISGKVSVMSIIPAITKLMNDKKQLEKLSTIIPIIEKYTENDGK